MYFLFTSTCKFSQNNNILFLWQDVWWWFCCDEISPSLIRRTFYWCLIQFGAALPQPTSKGHVSKSAQIKIHIPFSFLRLVWTKGVILETMDFELAVLYMYVCMHTWMNSIFLSLFVLDNDWIYFALVNITLTCRSSCQNRILSPLWIAGYVQHLVCIT